MKKLLLVLMGLALVVSISFAFDSQMITFYQSSTTTPWTIASTGTPKSVLPLNTWTCQADTASVTAMVIRITGNLIGSVYPTSSPIATETCDATDLVQNNRCIFTFTLQPVNSLRLDVTSMTGTNATTTRITCLGINP